jgi:hypothetical protein
MQRHVEAERFRGLEVDDQLEFRRLDGKSADSVPLDHLCLSRGGAVQC